MSIPFITIPPSAPHTHTVVFLHGRGDNAQSFASSLRYSQDSSNRTFPEIFPSFRWVFPQAELRQCAAFPSDKIPQWFDIWNVKDFSEREELQATGLRESVAAIRRLLASEATILGGQWDRLVLAGISQGAATGAHTLLNLSLPLAVRANRKVLGLEGVLDTDEVLRNTPVLLEHCADDPLVLVVHGRGLRETLRGFGAQVTWKEYPKGGHWFNSPAGVDDAVEFLNDYVLRKPSAGGNTSSEVHESPDSMDLS